jgi:hypothetical protein
MTTTNDIDFADSDFILNYKPDIRYVAPSPDVDYEYLKDSDIPVQIEVARDRTKALIQGYQALADLADVAQKRIDNRVISGGGVEAKTDPIIDDAVKQAILRQFPEEDGTRITYEMYKECLRYMQENAPPVPSLVDADINAARKDKYRTNFGGWNTGVGENRPELATQSQIVKPVDVNAFKEAQISKLLKIVVDAIGF